MVDRAEIQAKYIDLYKVMRTYIWSYPTVEALAELEVSCYQTCPDIFAIRRNFYRLNQLVQDVKRDDEDLTDALNGLSDVINSSDDVFSRLDTVNEVIQR